MIYSESYSHDVQSLNFWKVCSKTNDSFIFLILLTISGDCREALPSFPLQTSPARQCAVLGKPGGRDDRVNAQTIPSSPPAFYFEILVFSYSLIFFAENPSGAPSARTARPSIYFVNIFTRKSFYQGHRPRGSCAHLFLSSDRDRRNDIQCVLFTIDVYYLVCFS